MKNYLMRSLMFVPAHNQHLLDSALRRNADMLLFDIEVPTLGAHVRYILKRSACTYC